MRLKPNARRRGKEASVSEAYIPTRTVAAVGLSPEPVDTREFYYLLYYFLSFL